MVVEPYWLAVVSTRHFVDEPSTESTVTGVPTGTPDRSGPFAGAGRPVS
ncbi:hypothetical protein [Nocardia wallacei]